MVQPIRFPDGIRTPTITLENGGTISGIDRTSLSQESLSPNVIPLTDFRIWDAMASLLTATPGTDDLGLVGGTFGTGSPTIQTGDLKAAGSTDRRARVLVRLPMNYDAGADVILRFHSGMLTTISDTAATLDVEVYLSDEEGGVDGAGDLVTTAATTINSLTLADTDFVVSAGSLSPGDLLDVRITINVNDGASGTSVIGQIGAAKLMCDTKG